MIRLWRGARRTPRSQRQTPTMIVGKTTTLALLRQLPVQARRPPATPTLKAQAHFPLEMVSQAMLLEMVRGRAVRPPLFLWEAHGRVAGVRKGNTLRWR